MHIKTFGLELEFFVTPLGFPDNYVLAGDLPKDSCGYLAEARGKPSSSILESIYLLNAEIDRITRIATGHGLMLKRQNTADIPREQLRVWLRKFGKSSANSFFMGGKCYKNNNPRAGLHVHFGNELTLEGGCKMAGMINIPRIVRIMDLSFKDEIKAAKRMPGEYEIKGHGFEYRSLPATINLSKVELVLNEIIKD